MGSWGMVYSSGGGSHSYTPSGALRVASRKLALPEFRPACGPAAGLCISRDDMCRAAALTGVGEFALEDEEVLDWNAASLLLVGSPLDHRYTGHNPLSSSYSCTGGFLHLKGSEGSSGLHPCGTALVGTSPAAAAGGGSIEVSQSFGRSVSKPHSDNLYAHAAVHAASEEWAAVRASVDRSEFHLQTDDDLTKYLSGNISGDHRNTDGHSGPSTDAPNTFELDMPSEDLPHITHVPVVRYSQCMTVPESATASPGSSTASPSSTEEGAPGAHVASHAINIPLVRQSNPCRLLSCADDLTNSRPRVGDSDGRTMEGIGGGRGGCRLSAAVGSSSGGDGGSHAVPHSERMQLYMRLTQGTGMPATQPMAVPRVMEDAGDVPHSCWGLLGIAQHS